MHPPKPSPIRPKKNEPYNFQISPIIVEPYNAVFTTHGAMELENCCFLMDNEAAFDICSRHLDVERPTYTNINRLLGQVLPYPDDIPWRCQKIE